MTIHFFYLEIGINEKLCIKCLIISIYNSFIINIYIKKVPIGIFNFYL